MTRKSFSSNQSSDEMKKAEKTRASLLEEINDIEKKLEPFGSVEAVALKSETKKIKARLESLDANQLFNLRNEIDNIKERTKSLVYEQSWWARAIKWLSIRPMVWLAIIGLILLMYMVPIWIWQGRHQGEIQSIVATRTAAVLQTAMPTATETPTLTPTATQ